MTSKLESLPNELLDLMFHLTPDRTTLHSLCLVSRSINRLATAHLYTHITLLGDDFKYLRPLALLFWTSAPHREAVRSFAVHHAYGGNLDPWPKHVRQEGLKEGELEGIIRWNVEAYVNKGDWERWYEEVRDGSDSTRIASLLLRSCPRLVRMQLPGFELVDPGAR
ncbi:hypothetical protein AA0111_g8883 [Alternaria arborescens]|uniref:hypothetical protein n=1 Tax=Alternaria arborescens TaxID=156630 RepID=UPI001075314D|nr:hypothetical protein AA0111_g8883 [Alternaria arborescens]RYO23975.1 hypothetical protein AA0111_g8883 [Alternaria arborescens]